MKLLVLDVLIRRNIRKVSKKDCGCSHPRRNLLRNLLVDFLCLKEKFSLKEDHNTIEPSIPHVLSVRSLATGRLSVLCGRRRKSKQKLWICFLTTYDPAEWDLVSHRSDGEYFSVTDDSDSDNDSHHSSSDSDILFTT
jgi:hypothetical protein